MVLLDIVAQEIPAHALVHMHYSTNKHKHPQEKVFPCKVRL